MALALLNTLPTNELTPKIGCGLVYCLDEEEYELEAGVKSFIPIIFNLLNPIFDGDVMVLRGFTFTFTASPPSNANEIQINGANTAANVLARLQTFPFFADNYNVTQPNTYEVYVEAINEGLDYNYGFSVTTANPNSILINPVYPPLLITAGADAIVKEDYYVFMDVIDVLNGETKICSAAFDKPLNVLSDGSNKVCFDVQKIIEDYRSIRTSPPAPLPTISSGTNDWDWYEPNFVGQFRFRFYGTYRNPNNNACDRITTETIVEPAILGLRLYVANIILEPDADYTIEQFSFFDAPSFPIRPITIHPEDYKFCKDTAWEWRVDFPVDLIQNVLGGIAWMNLYYFYTDGSSQNFALNFSTNFDGVQIISMNIGNTLPAANPAKTLERVRADIQYSVMASPFVTVATKTWYINHDTDNCCVCNKQFYFLSKFGNNETIIARCEYTIDFEVEQFVSCTEYTCGGVDFLDTDVYDGGETHINVDKRARLNTVLIECNNSDYLEAFLESPVKYVYEDGKLYRILQTETSYNIYSKEQGERFVMQFTYKKSLDIVRRHFSQ